MQNSPYILIIYHQADYPTRSTVLDHLYSFGHHANARCFYLNIAIRNVPDHFMSIPFDLVIFHTTFLSIRWHRQTFIEAVKKVHALKEMPVIKVAFPQDEFINMDLVCDFIQEFNIQHVFSVADSSQWPILYPNIDQKSVQFHSVLTGYLNPKTVARIQQMGSATSDRPVDIGYRAWRAEPWLGRHGFLKTRIAEEFQRAAPSHHLSTDISTRSEDTLFGDDWLRFLLRCRYTVGVEGGASLLDWNGSIREKTQDYLERHPNAPWSEVEGACFSGLEGQIDLRALSPRQLEACATHTCQVLVEGVYSDVLKAGVHYIAIKKDLSNIDTVLDQMSNKTLRSQIAETAYRDIVASRRYEYPHFINLVFQNTFENMDTSQIHLIGSHSRWSGVAWRWAQFMDICSWAVVQLYARLRPIRQASVNVLVTMEWGKRWRERRHLSRGRL